VRFMVERGANAKSEGFVYFIQNVDSGNVKIGFSVNPFIRAAQLGTACRVVAFFPAARAAEFDMHELFLGSWISGEWFDITDEMAALVRFLCGVREWESLGFKLPSFEYAEVLERLNSLETVPATVTVGGVQ
jgi:hypothetical protein